MVLMVLELRENKKMITFFICHCGSITDSRGKDYNGDLLRYQKEIELLKKFSISFKIEYIDICGECEK